MIANNVELRVLVKGKPISEFFHRGQFFIEGRAGSTYEIEFRNNNPYRVEAIISVDGLAITDGKAAGPQSSGYLVNAHDVVRIPGWKVDGSTAAAFQFSGKQDSYATGVSGGDSRNNGVIGVMVYRERVMAPRYTQYASLSASGWNGSPYDRVVNSSLGGAGLQSMNASNTSASSFTAASAKLGLAKGMSNGIARGIAPSGVGAAPFIGVAQSMGGWESFGATTSYQPGSATDSYQPQNMSAPVEQALGTGFGEATTFKTTSVNFDRADLLVMMVLQYDDLRGLKARGVPVERRGRPAPTQPQAFPAMSEGCVPPTGWQR